MQRVTAFFTQDGVPKTGLTPTIRIWNLSTNSLVVTDSAMTENGGGLYFYNFSAFDPSGDYSIRCDGGATLTGAERYTYGGNDYVSYSDISDQVSSGDSSIG